MDLDAGHNRLEALRQLRIPEVDLPVRKIDDTRMAQIMAHENMVEWSHNAAVEQETVRAIIEAYGAGRLPGFPQPSPRSERLRFAPSFISVPRSSEPESGASAYAYTSETLVAFLGWKEGKVRTALEALATIEQGLLDTRDFAGLKPKQAQAITRETRRARASISSAKAEVLSLPCSIRMAS